MGSESRESAPGSLFPQTPLSKPVGNPNLARAQIVSEPAGAAVRLGNDFAGFTPLDTSLLAGSYRLEVSLEGHETHVGTLSLTRRQPVVERIRLIPRPAGLEIQAEADNVQVFFDDVLLGVSPLHVEGLASARYRLRLETDRGRTWEGEADLSPGEHRILAPTLAEFSDTFPELEPWHAERPLAVVIDNISRARPQSGLGTAEVVYEALAEGGITRFLALYVTNEAQVIGPVRSARHYFVYWASEYGAALALVGSSPDGFAALAQAGIPRIEPLPKDGPIWRTPTRPAPHNAYTSTAAAMAAVNDLSPTHGSWAGLRFKNGNRRFRGPDVGRIAVEYHREYSVSYHYEPDGNFYLRGMQGRPHRDADTGEHLTASTLVVLRVPSRVVDQALRIDLAMVGEGEALYFLDGTVIEGFWRKTGRTQPTRFFDQDGVPVLFNPGTVWIQVIPLDAKVSFGGFLPP